jgi:phasin family protein
MATNKTTGAKQAEDFVKNAFESFTQNIDALSSFTKESIDAVVKSSSATSKNVEDLMAEVLNCTKSNVENCVAAAKDMASARSIEQLVAIQTEQSKKYFENYVCQMTKMTEIFTNLSKEATAPLNERASSFSEKFAKKAA